MPVMEDENPQPGFEIIHTTNLCLVDATGRVVGKYNSVKDEDMALLRRDLDRLLEATPAASAADESTESESTSLSKPDDAATGGE
jgi:hypothetical protein